MTGAGSRQPAKQAEEPGKAGGAASHTLPAGLVMPGILNVMLCYLMTLTGFLSPVALLFSILFANESQRLLRAHYFFIRTTVAIFVIGLCLGCLLVLLGASLSTALILAGLGILLLTALWTILRCLGGFCYALRRQPPRNYRSYFI